MTPLQSVQAHRGTVKAAARKVARQAYGHVDADDLEQDGLLALLEMNLDADAGEKQTAAYISQRARGAMLDRLRAEDPCPRSVRMATRKIAAAERSLELTLGRRPRAAEVADAAEFDLSKYFRAIQQSFAGATLSSEFDDAAATLDDVFLAQHGPTHGVDPLDSALSNELWNAIEAACAALPPRHLCVLTAIFIHGETCAAVGERLGFTESRASQICKTALGAVRDSLTRAGLI